MDRYDSKLTNMRLETATRETNNRQGWRRIVYRVIHNMGKLVRSGHLECMNNKGYKFWANSVAYGDGGMVSGGRWYQTAKDRTAWKQINEAFIQEWTDNG
ncbi:hypothetical protein HUJ04_000464 [Dendroctonus ponderosae]|nr:hypothetical protein HUJ04_000464 [Dendroctonus ponderosae]